MSAFAPEDPDDYSYAEADPTETSVPPISQDQSMGRDAEASHGRGHSNNPLLGSDNPLVSDLEQEVLEEYARLLRNVNQVRDDLCSWSGRFYFVDITFLDGPCRGNLCQKLKYSRITDPRTTDY